MEPLLSIIIPTRNRRALLLETLEGLRKQSAAPDSYEIVVAADGCTDGTPQAVREMAANPAWARHTLTCVEQEWSGAAAARNTGLRTARGEIVLFLDDDVMAGRDLVAAHLARHAIEEKSEIRNQNSEFRDQQSKIQNRGAPWATKIVLGHIIPEPEEGALHRQVSRWWRDHYRRLAEGPVTFAALFTGNVSLPRGVALDVGGLDEALDYGEDVEFGYRLSRAGLEFMYAPEAVGRTRNPKPAPALLRDFYRSGQGSALIYRKWPETFTFLALSAFGETNLRMRLLRGLLLALSNNRFAADLIDKGFGWWAASRSTGRVARSMFELARSLYYWRGVRAQVGRGEEWAGLASAGVPVLMYHSVQPRTSAGNRRERFTIHQDRLARQMALLRVLRYRVLPLEVLAREWGLGRPPPARSLAITFDDGYVDALEHAWPVLRRFGYPATLFVPTGIVGGRAGWDASIEKEAKSLLTWEDLAGLDREGVRVEAHGVSHLDLAAVEPAVAEREVREARVQIEQRLGRPSSLFAYPYGRSTPEVQKMVEEAGYSAAVTARPGLNTPRTERFALKRVEIWGTDSLIMFALKVWAGDNPFRHLRR